MRYSSDLKLNAVKYYLNNSNQSIRYTSNIFGCEKSLLDRWINRYITYGTVDNKPRKEGSYKIRSVHVKFISSLIKNKPNIFLWQIIEKNYEKFHMTISKGHLVNIIKYLNLTYKKFYINHNPVKRYGQIINYKKKFAHFFNKIKKYNLNNIICVDETSIQIGIGNIRGRILMGKRLYKKTNTNDIFKKYTLISAISNKRTIKWKLYRDKGIDTMRFEKFLHAILKNRKNKLIATDNASAHRNQHIKKIIKEMKHDYLHILPYKHYLNCIENYFNQLKHYIKQQEAMNYDKIKKAIEYAIKHITKQNYANYFYNAYDKNKLTNKYKNTFRLHKKPKIYKK